MELNLYPHQLEAIEKLHNGSILCAGVGTGKSRTALAYYYFKVCQGSVPFNMQGSFKKMKNPRDLFIITTAKKRDSKEWEDECIPFHISKEPNGVADVHVTVDSWNNIRKYRKVIGAFFIFDEQRVVGSGAWVKAFLDIARKNQWILLSATPGDTWTDYIPVFVANGFYKNKTEFLRKHAVFSRFAKYPKIDKFVGTKYLEKLRNEILVHMVYDKKTLQIHNPVFTAYNKDLYLTVMRDRWDPYENEPIKETGKLFYLLRKVVNSDATRITAVSDILKEHNRVIIFYNFDYELEMLRQLCTEKKLTFSEWNGQKHEAIPNVKKWAYLVQYSAGAEGWNCIDTNVIIFFSQNYSYRIMVQAAGRIDRMNTLYDILYYYHLKSHAPIDLAISRSLNQKKNFNERSYLGKYAKGQASKNVMPSE